MLPAFLTIQGWPATSGFKERALDCETTHSIVPLPAYDLDGEIIHPTQYERKLPGAIVEAVFHLVSYCINGTRNVLVLEMQALKILIAGVPMQSAAEKRRLDLVNQVSKKRRVQDH